MVTNETRRRRGSAVTVTLRIGAGAFALACGHAERDVPLEKPAEEAIGIPDVPVPPANGPRLGALATRTPIFDRPSNRGSELGYLHAGATVPRAATPFSTRGCAGGWFPIAPRGFVCVGAVATTDVAHPTLVAMAIAPDAERALPYTYARAVRDTTLFEVDASREDGARPLAPLRARSGMAIVGSWLANDPAGKPLRLAMTTEGRFVPTEDVEALVRSDFHGIELSAEKELPLAFVVKRGVRAWVLGSGTPEKRDLLRYHEQIPLTGKTRTVDRVEFWSTTDGRWLRLQDVTLVRERHEMPAFATGEQKWLDVSIVTGTLVAYEGRKPVFATLASVGRDRLGAPGSDAATTRGELTVTGKHVTAIGRDVATFADGQATHDVPWVLELSSGQLIVGAYWHDRFGIEHGPGNIELAPADAARLFRWSDPELPAGWHGVTGKPAAGKTTIVNVRR